MLTTQTPKRIQKLDPLEPWGKFYKEYIGVIWGIYFLDPPRGLGSILILDSLCYRILKGGWFKAGGHKGALGKLTEA